MENIRKLVDCSVCLDEMKDPRILPCHHSFCLACIPGLHGQDLSLKCPNCNRLYLLRSPEMLPKDDYTNTLRENLISMGVSPPSTEVLSFAALLGKWNAPTKETPTQTNTTVKRLALFITVIVSLGITILKLRKDLLIQFILELFAQSLLFCHDNLVIIAYFMLCAMYFKRQSIVQFLSRVVILGLYLAGNALHLLLGVLRFVMYSLHLLLVFIVIVIYLLLIAVVFAWILSAVGVFFMCLAYTPYILYLTVYNAVKWWIMVVKLMWHILVYLGDNLRYLLELGAAFITKLW